MTRNVRIRHTGFVAALVILGAGSTMLDRHATVSAATVMAPRFEVDPMWPKPLPNHWVIGMTIGVSVDAKENVWIDSRQGSLEPKEVYQIAKDKDGKCFSRRRSMLRRRAAADPFLRPRKAISCLKSWGGPGQGLRLAGFEPRHHDRLQR